MKKFIFTCLLFSLAMSTHAGVQDSTSENILRCVTISKKSVDSKNGEMKEALTSESKDLYNFRINLSNGEISGAYLNTKENANNKIISKFRNGSFYRQISSFSMNNSTIYFQIQQGLFEKDAPYSFIGIFFDYSMSGICFDTKKHV